MRDDIEQARRAGYSDDQIAQVLAESDPEVKQALGAGYKPGQVLSVLQDTAGQQARQSMQDQSWGSYAADLAKGVMYGAGNEAKAVGTTLSRPADATAPNGAVNTAGDALQGAGQAAQAAVGDYKPAAFDWRHPIDTAGQLPKAVAESVPGLGAAVAAGGAGAAAGGLAGSIVPGLGTGVGATVGGLAGVGSYAYTRYWGQNANAHAAEQGRAKPVQADFDATQKESLLQAGIDAASLRAGGLIGGLAKPATAGAALGQTAKTAAALGGQSGVNGIIGQTAAMDETRPGQDTVAGRLANVDYNQAANDAVQGLALGAVSGLARGAKYVAETPGRAIAKSRYGVDAEANPLTAEAVTRVVDHMNSDGFPADPANPKQAAQAVRAGTAFFKDRLDGVAKNPQAFGLDDRAQAAVSEARSYLNSGAVLNEKQLARYSETLKDSPEAFQTLADASAMNWTATKAKLGDADSVATGFGLGKLLRHPGKSTTLAGLGVELLPHLIGGAHALSGAGLPIVAGGLALKGAGKLTGISDALNNPLGQITQMHGSTPAGSPLGRTMSAGEALAAARALNAMRDANPSASTAAPAGMPGPAPIHTPAPVFEAPTAPGATPAHTTLRDALGVGPAAQSPLGAALPPQPAPAPAPAPAPRAPVPPQARSAMAIPDILAEMKTQALAENQPLLDVAHLHHRSARAMATDLGLPEAVRDAAGSQASDIWHGIITSLESSASPAEIKRARSAKQVDAAPAPSLPRRVAMERDSKGQMVLKRKTKQKPD